MYTCIKTEGTARRGVFAWSDMANKKEPGQSPVEMAFPPPTA